MEVTDGKEQHLDDFHPLPLLTRGETRGGASSKIIEAADKIASRAPSSTSFEKRRSRSPSSTETLEMRDLVHFNQQSSGCSEYRCRDVAARLRKSILASTV